MISIVSNSGHVAHGIKKYVLDTEDDKDNLPVDIAAGSEAYVIESGITYILNSKGEWSQNMSTSGGGGTPGAPGKNGKSAYELAVEGGFSGTQAEWLESLKGQDGQIPYIGANGNWFIGDVDTNVAAQENDYSKLVNRPTIGGVPLEGNALDDLVEGISLETIQSMLQGGNN